MLLAYTNNGCRWNLRAKFRPLALLVMSASMQGFKGGFCAYAKTCTSTKFFCAGTGSKPPPYESMFFSEILKQKICCGYSKEPSQRVLLSTQNIRLR